VNSSLSLSLSLARVENFFSLSPVIRNATLRAGEPATLALVAKFRIYTIFIIVNNVSERHKHYCDDYVIS